MRTPCSTTRATAATALCSSSCYSLPPARPPATRNDRRSGRTPPQPVVPRPQLRKPQQPSPLLSPPPTAPPPPPAPPRHSRPRSPCSKSGPRFGQPTPQDEEGRGIFPRSGSTDHRSEPVYPPFVLGPRRQTDEMVRQLYQLLPNDVRRSTAFVIPDRIAQNPDAYLPYLRSRERVVLLGNFVGIGEATGDEAWFVQRHQLELEIGEQTIALVQALGKQVADVRYTMGDSSSVYSEQVRAQLQSQLDAMLARHSLQNLHSPITWGADEMVAVAFAAQLPPLKVRVTYASTTARHHYDGNRTTPEVVEPIFDALGLAPVEQGFDFEVLVFTNVSDDDGTFPDEAAQEALDTRAFAPFAAYTEQERARLAIIDARMFNGAWNEASAPPHCDYLAYGSWGTLANKVGLTLATAKLLLAAGKNVARSQLLLEAVAHDVYANGYRDGRDQFAPLLAKQGIVFDHFNGYDTADGVTTVFKTLNAFVNERMARHYADTSCMSGRTIRITPQLWRTFESETHLLPHADGELDAVGVYRTDLDPAVFDPTHGADLRRLPLEKLP